MEGWLLIPLTQLPRHKRTAQLGMVLSTSERALKLISFIESSTSTSLSIELSQMANIKQLIGAESIERSTTVGLRVNAECERILKKRDGTFLRTLNTNSARPHRSERYWKLPTFR